MSNRRVALPGGFPTNDGTVDFYLRVRALLPDAARIVDFGAGRGEWLEDECEPRRRLRDLRDVAATVVGVDVDPIVMTNPTLSAAWVLDPGEPVPLEDSSADLIVADFVLEHLDDPAWFAREAARVLEPGAWLCARTPSRRGYVAVGARLVPNRLHSRSLTRLQPDRQPGDVFPTRYRVNTMTAIDRCFGPWFENHSFPFWANLDYGGHLAPLRRAERAWRLFFPDSMAPFIYVFLRRS
jgi:SAM-dependent methyltransferase